MKEYIFPVPGPVPECHASTVVMLPDGELLAAWFGGSKEGNPDVQIWVSRRTLSGWSPPVCVTKEEGIPHWNPVLYLDEQGKLLLFYKIGHQIPYWKTMVMESLDFGRNWSSPRELVSGDSGGRGPVKNKPIRISNGTLLAPASLEQGPWRCFVDVCRDGIHWEKKPIPAGEESLNMIQPSLWEAPEGHIHALMRSSRGFIYRSDSKDFGETWCNAYPTAVPNNNSGLDCVCMEDGRIALVCNPVEKDWGPRSPLTLFVSRDKGETFEKVMDLETEPGEYSYPAVISQGNILYITYTWNRKTICFRKICL